MFLLCLLVFALFALIPGDFLTEMELNPTVSPSTIEKLRQEFGIGAPLPVQYWRWLSNLARGNLGYSFVYRRPVRDVLLERIGSTLSLTLAAFGLVLVLALPAGLAAAWRAGGIVDKLVLALSLAGTSLPTVLASLVLLMMAFAVGGSYLDGEGGFRLWLPALSLAIPSASFICRVLRLEYLAALEAPHIQAARALGLRPRTVAWRAFRYAANPVISLGGLVLGGLLSGSVVAEKVFGRPGLGALAVDAVLARDLYVAVAAVLVAALFVIVANLLADVLLALNDPRVREEMR
ncbi:MAG: ABC transporter permease [Acidobacteriota bacterium]